LLLFSSSHPHIPTKEIINEEERRFNQDLASSSLEDDDDSAELMHEADSSYSDRH
jgi:hypothetical protein